MQMIDVTIKSLMLLYSSGLDDWNLQENVAHDGSESQTQFVLSFLFSAWLFSSFLLFFCDSRIKSLQFLCRLTRKESSVFWKEIMRSWWKARCSTTMSREIAILHKLVVIFSHSRLFASSCLDIHMCCCNIKVISIFICFAWTWRSAGYKRLVFSSLLW